MKIPLKSPPAFIKYGHLMEMSVKPKVTKSAVVFVKRIY
jgi:hypothetical protein